MSRAKSDTHVKFMSKTREEGALFTGTTPIVILIFIMALWTVFGYMIFSSMHSAGIIQF